MIMSILLILIHVFKDIMYEHAWIFINRFFKFCILGILYHAIMHKCGFVQDYCLDLLKIILRKFILYFLSIIVISTYFRSLYGFLEL
jgi:hypothetical protein